MRVLVLVPLQPAVANCELRRPPTAGLRVYLPERAPRSHVQQDVGKVRPRSHPVQCDGPVASPDDPSSQETRGSHWPESAPGRPSYTCVPPPAEQTDRAQTPPPSAPLLPGTLSPHLAPQYTVRPLLPSAPHLAAHQAHRL